MEHEPEQPDHTPPSGDDNEEPPPYRPDPRLMDVMERGAETDPAEAWARLTRVMNRRWATVLGRLQK
jgi:hypothetical protein